MTPTAPRNVGPDEAARMVEQGAVLLDVREDDEWRAGHAPQARHVPLGSLANRQEDIPVDAPLVAVCRSGQRSSTAATALSRAGYDVVNLAGGMKGWRDSGHPLVTEDGEPGRVA